jgi:hypothetical protein
MDLSTWEHGIRQASSTEFWFWVGLLAVVTLGAGLLFVRNLRRARMMEDTPTSRIRSAAQGYVELDGVGELMDGPVIASPLTGERCTWYSFKVERREQVRQGKSRRSRWRQLRSGRSDSLFRLVDATGECVVDPEGASVLPSVSRVWYGHAPDPSGPPPKRAFLGGLLVTGRYRYTEQLMRPGDRLYAMGLFKTLGTGTDHRSVREDVRDLLREWKREPDRHLKVYDDNGDGRIDQEEWREVQRGAVRAIHARRLRDGSGPAVNVLSRPAERPFILSAIPEQDLVRRYRRFAAGSVALLLVAGLGTAWMLNVRLDDAPGAAATAMIEYR